MPNDFYLVQFSAEEDYRHALYEGPWMIADHYIVVQRWRPFFNVTASKTRKVAAWIRIPGLPIELYNERFLWRVGSKLGSMLKIDKLTSIHSRGLHAICFKCGRYGHRQDQCGESFDHEKETTASCPKDHEGAIEVENDSHGGGQPNSPCPINPSMDACNNSVENNTKSGGDPEKSGRDSDNPYGPWMLVKRGRKSFKNHISPKNKDTNSTQIISSGANKQEAVKSLEDRILTDYQEKNNPKTNNTRAMQTHVKVRNPLGGKNPRNPSPKINFVGPAATRKKGGEQKTETQDFQDPKKGNNHENHITPDYRSTQAMNTQRVMVGLRSLNHQSSEDPFLRNLVTHVIKPDEETAAFAAALRRHFEPDGEYLPAEERHLIPQVENPGVSKPTNQNSLQ
uniref:CCHC-type domain-containing protein n=1 Tax=Cajanus cajan TaxID=3821 RepID=A0A151SGY5_CAJCA|nr:hypothetical protein KK1_000195 [Cajanus cajan]